MNFYEKTYAVTPLITDMFGLCRPSSLLGFLQDISVRHEAELGYDRGTLLKEHNALWLMVRVWYRLERPLRADESIRLSTWQRPAEGVLIYRDFNMLCGSERIGEAVTAWTLVDRQTFAPKRPRFIQVEPPEAPKPMTPGKLSFPGVPRPAGSRTVGYSDTDLNGHMNNTRYADVVCDAACMHQYEGFYASAMQINYIKESLPGDELRLAKSIAGNTTYIRASGPEGSVKFNASLEKKRIL